MVFKEKDGERNMQEKGRAMERSRALPSSPSVGWRNTAWLAAVNTEKHHNHNKPQAVWHAHTPNAQPALLTLSRTHREPLRPPVMTDSLEETTQSNKGRKTTSTQ